MRRTRSGCGALCWRCSAAGRCCSRCCGPRLAAGVRLRLPTIGVIGFLDLGVHDPKVVFSVGPVSARDRAGLELFFRVYARFKRGLARVRRQPEATGYLGWLR